MPKDMSDSDNPPVKTLTLGRSDVSAQRGFAAFMIGLGVLAAGRGFYAGQGTSTHLTETWPDSSSGLGFPFLCLGGLVLWSASFTNRHLDASAPFWQRVRTTGAPGSCSCAQALGFSASCSEPSSPCRAPRLQAERSLASGRRLWAWPLGSATGLITPISFR